MNSKQKNPAFINSIRLEKKYSDKKTRKSENHRENYKEFNKSNIFTPLTDVSFFNLDKGL